MEDIFAIFMVFGTGMLAVIAFSPIGKALAEKLRGHQPQALPSEDLDDVRAHLQSLQEQVSELAERQDFTERMLAQTKEKAALGPGPAKEAAS